MTNGLLLDTHIALWLESGNQRLGKTTRALVDECWRDGGTIYLSAVTAWEIALLVDLGRLELDATAAEWIDVFLDRPGFQGIALKPNVAAISYQFRDFDCRDPADRLLIATAIDLACPLVTYDDRITRFAQRHGRQYRFTARH